MIEEQYTFGQERKGALYVLYWVRSISFPGSTPQCSLGWAPDKS